MLDRLDRVIDEAGVLHHQLLIVHGRPGAGKTELLRHLAARRGCSVLNLGLKLAPLLQAIPKRQRPLHAPSVWRDMCAVHDKGQPLMLDNIELLFDRTLKLDPIDALRQLSRGRTVVVTWPGTVHAGRLVYAEMGHPEHQNYAVQGCVLFPI